MAEKKVQKIARKTLKKERRVEPMLPGGFRDYGPEDAIARSEMLNTVRKTFEIFGFDPMETASVQRKEVLFGGEKESEKIVFEVKGSREKKSDTALRFDLTVPFARFMAANPEIPKPFKRYQIGTVWRGESPQAGRYREFKQADIDIIGSSSYDADAEVIATIYWTLKNLGINDFVIKINSRKILNLLSSYAYFPKEKLWSVLRIIDKKDRIGNDMMRKELTREVGEKSTKKIDIFLNRNIAEVENEFFQIRNILEVMGIDKKKIVIDYTIIRGLAYYTGMVLETFLTKAPEMGSIASGGRYDELVIPYTGQKIPAVGASIGIDRLYAALEKLGSIKKKTTTTQVLMLNLSSEFKFVYFQIVKRLRDENINTAFYLGDDTSFQGQFAYAVKKEIPFVVILGDEEKKKGVIAVKNLMTREQKEMKGIEELIQFLK